MGPNTYEFLQIFIVFKFFFFFFKFCKSYKKSRNLDMFSQKDYALHSRSFRITDRNDLQIRLKHFSINGYFKNYFKKSEKIHMY